MTESRKGRDRFIADYNKFMNTMDSMTRSKSWATKAHAAGRGNIFVPWFPHGGLCGTMCYGFAPSRGALKRGPHVPSIC
jgi:hypothetical protein